MKKLNFGLSVEKLSKEAMREIKGGETAIGTCTVYCDDGSEHYLGNSDCNWEDAETVCEIFWGGPLMGCTCSYTED